MFLAKAESSPARSDLQNLEQITVFICCIRGGRLSIISDINASTVLQISLS